MIKFISERVAVKVTLYVNLLLLVVMGAGAAYMIIDQGAALEAQLLERGKTESMTGAKMTGVLIEEAIDNGVFTIRDAFDTAYEKIPGFNPPKFHTKYDFYLDKALLGIEDEFLKDKSVVYAVAADVNGYVPTHNTRYNQPPTGDPEKDLILNRTKRIFSDKVGLAAAQNLNLGFLQVYSRDTGETMWDISSPIMVKGKHWGGFRIGYSLEKINAAKFRMMISTLLIMGAIFLISFILVFITVQRSLLPIKELTDTSIRLVEGQINQKIAVKGNDEIGKLADALERLRFSLKTAMDRLARK
ncbi:HAMP domain-containing protein [Desulfatitalea tepidiphila]|uniref:HAMP domain-containing protein n=1 Tax=Desulfatitalea tepidiphila TaxID=1185843 RepID=UPI000A75AF92|nr:HAMP domain-containing protein [Desulfatitalea tepidiphila]